jgi:peroxiredoxin
VELRDAMAELDDVVILYVMAESQVNEKTQWFIDGNSLRERVLFLVDPESAVIDQLNLRRPNPEAMEAGVPHPSTYVIDREGVVRMVDVREDYHFWLDPAPVLAALQQIP